MTFLSRQQQKEQNFYLKVLSGKKNKQRAGPYPKESPNKAKRRVTTPSNVTSRPKTREAGSSGTQTEAGTSGIQTTATEAGTSEILSNISEETIDEETGAPQDSSSLSKKRKREDNGIFN